MIDRGTTTTSPGPAPPSAAQDARVAAAWAVLAALAVAALFPYLLQVMPALRQAPVPLGVLVVLQAVQAMVMVGLLAWLGLRMGHRVGLGSPVMRAWLVHRTAPDWARLRPLQALAIGVAAGLALVGLAAVVDGLLPPAINPPAQASAGTSALNGLLASFYGGIVEELQLRLFLMTLVVWLVARTRRRAAPAAAYWGAIILAAVLFGAGHLPAAAHVWGLDAVVVARTLLLNAIGGLAFGWLYWKRGIEMAMLAHFGADLVLHVAVPLLAPGTAP